MVFVSIAVLITGVVLLSLKSSAKAAGDPYTPNQPDGTPIDPSHGDAPENVVWEVGSVSDEESDNKTTDPGRQRGQGERSGLLRDEEPDEDTYR
jgi:hypothetical protein